MVCIAWPSAACRDDRNLRASRVKGEMISGLALELPGHHHRPLPVNHCVGGHPHAGGQHLAWIVVAQLSLLDIASGRSERLKVYVKERPSLSIHDQGPRLVSHGKVWSAKGHREPLVRRARDCDACLPVRHLRVQPHVRLCQRCRRLVGSSEHLLEEIYINLATVDLTKHTPDHHRTQLCWRHR